MKNLTGLWVNLFRVLEIGKLGNFSVSVYFDKDYTEGFDDYMSIKSFCLGWFENFKEDGDIRVEIEKPYNYESRKTFESLEDIDKRIIKASGIKRPEIVSNNVSDSLIKTATQRMNLSLSQVETAKNISAVIAQLDLSDTIKIEHTAESLQYVFNCNDVALNAENESICFGSKISIKLGNIESDMIQKAIDYLMFCL